MVWPDTPEHRRIDRLLAAVRRPGIMLHRPYPPAPGGTGSAQTGRSRLGGLPEMPAEMEWPTGLDDRNRPVKLHFLALIDCAALPRIDRDLPASGLLLFFARQDEECVWGQKPPASRDGRVIYVPAGAPTRTHAAPEDLPPIHDRTGPTQDTSDEHWVLEGERYPNTHPSWPLIALPIDTWPDCAALGQPPIGPSLRDNLRWRLRGLPLPPLLKAEYDMRVAMLRAAAVLAAIGPPAPAEQDASDVGRLLGSDRFPLPWLLLDRIARGTLIDCRSILRMSGAAKNLAAGAEPTAAEAKAWLDRSRGQPLDASVAPEIAQEFRAWLAALKAGRMAPYRLARTLDAAAAHCIAEIGGTPRAAALPLALYRALERQHRPFGQQTGFQSPNGPHRQGTTRIHQMLGWAPATQRADASGDVCLLQLTSDPGIGLMFGDVGEASFWIARRDLAARRFEAARAVLQGH